MRLRKEDIKSPHEIFIFPTFLTKYWKNTIEICLFCDLTQKTISLEYGYERSMRKNDEPKVASGEIEQRTPISCSC